MRVHDINPRREGTGIRHLALEFERLRSVSDVILGGMATAGLSELKCHQRLSIKRAFLVGLDYPLTDVVENKCLLDMVVLIRLAFCSLRSLNFLPHPHGKGHAKGTGFVSAGAAGRLAVFPAVQLMNHQQPSSTVIDHHHYFNPSFFSCFHHCQLSLTIVGSQAFIVTSKPYQYDVIPWICHCKGLSSQPLVISHYS